MTVGELRDLMLILVEEGKEGCNIYCHGEEITIHNLKLIDNVKDLIPTGQSRRFMPTPPPPAQKPLFYK